MSSEEKGETQSGGVKTTTDEIATGAEGEGAKKVEIEEEKEVGRDEATDPAEAGKNPKQKLLDRAKRFGLDTPEVEEEKRLERSRRFNSGVNNDVNGTSNGAPDLTDQDKKLDRARRFGLPCAGLEALKMQQRAERFNIETVQSEEAKMGIRTKRFATTLCAGADTATPLRGEVEDTDEVRRKKRAERFGTVESDPDHEKKQRRLHRFGMGAASEDDKKEFRSKRFGTSTPSI